jgi:fucokinase
MRTPGSNWDYLIVTASNDAQAAAYEGQLRVRRELGLLAGVDDVLVVADPAGQRIGSGGSTLLCLIEVLRRRTGAASATRADWVRALRDLRVLIVHAGGDSRRLPAYGPCGKIFIPVPGESDSAIGATLFDRQLPAYLDLPAGGAPDGPDQQTGQIVITAGDVLLTFDPAEVRFAAAGITGLGADASPQAASKHGVYCAGPDGRVRLYLQKPSPAEQASRSAIDRYGQSILDIGVVAFDAETAATLLDACGVRASAAGSLSWAGATGQAIESLGLDFYREILCALGRDASAEHHAATAHASGSRWPAPLLGKLFSALSAIPFSVGVLPQCGFLHFGTTRQIIHSGVDLLRQDHGVSQGDSLLSLNNDVSESGRLSGADAWVEGCRITAPLMLEGDNVLVGVDVSEPLTLPRGACLDVVAGKCRRGEHVVFIRPHGAGDSFKDSLDQGATFCGLPLGAWIERLSAKPEDIWPRELPAGQRTLWNARVFPVETSPERFDRWLWMFDPATASPAQRKAWLEADRYAAAEIAVHADQDAFHARREGIRSIEILNSLRRLFRLDSHFAAADLARVLSSGSAAVAVLAEAHAHATDGEPSGDGAASFAFSRIIHSLGSAIQHLAETQPDAARHALADLQESLSATERAWAADLGLSPELADDPHAWAERARTVAFEQLSRTILHSGTATSGELPRHRLRADEIVWGRAPARLDLGGGWTDTPPYSLEHGGTVINAAVNLNGQPPIHCYGRVVPEPVIRIASIDLGTRIEITEVNDLLDYRKAGGEFSLAKARSPFPPSRSAPPVGLRTRPWPTCSASLAAGSS